MYFDIVKIIWCLSSVFCRLDCFYMFKFISDDIFICSNIFFGYSDYDVVYLELKNNNGINFGLGYWKFNNLFLLDKNFVNFFIIYWVDLI